MITVILEPEEIARVHGVSDNISDFNRAKGRKERGNVNARHGTDANRRLGLRGEYAFAKFLGVEWTNTGNKIERYDVGQKYQVRTRSRHEWELYLNVDGNHEEDVFVLCTSEKEDEVQIRGWAYGHEIRELGEFRQGRHNHPAYFLPNALLHDIAELPR